MVDAFTAENGATEVLPGSHHAEAFPPERFAEKNARRICGPRGSILALDGDVWHRARPNRTADFRVAFTCVLTRPNVKQMLDYPRYVSAEYAASLGPQMRQLLGFNARVPATIEEWYRPDDQRFYRRDQE
jgi:ectoine hydroxylase-related dioxygenase (phytanoyl-CoA dioxygenase family)